MALKGFGFDDAASGPSARDGVAELPARHPLAATVRAVVCGLVLVAVAVSATLALAGCSSAGSGSSASSGNSDNSAASASTEPETVSSTESSTHYVVLTADDILADLNGGQLPYTLVDVRTAEEYAEGHIPGAINIAYTNSSTPCMPDATSEAQDELYAAAGIAKDQPLVLYCRTGKRALYAADALDAAGYTDIKIYTGSWTDWTSDSSRPVEM